MRNCALIASLAASLLGFTAAATADVGDDASNTTICKQPDRSASAATPTPGAVALLGLAGIIGAMRRRRLPIN